MDNLVRGLVSKKKVRFQEDGFDLDLTYITPNIIAMGAPSTGQEAHYRNKMEDVQRFFETRHAGHYKIYDLRAEEGACYHPSKFNDSAVGYRFFDHNAAPLKLIEECCEDIYQFLNADAENVIAVHCKAGKGRTGLIISCVLLRMGFAPNASTALRAFGDIRTHDGKGVTIPSQMRYVHYYEVSLQRKCEPKAYYIRHVRLHTVPVFDIGGGSDPYFDVRLGDGKGLVFDLLKASNGSVKHYPTKAKYVDLPVAKYNVKVKGDVKMVFYDYDQMSQPDKMFHFWFHTGFIQNNYLLLHKNVLDRACKDKSCKNFAHNFKIEIFFEPLAAVDDDINIEGTEYLAGDHDEDLDEDEE